MVRSLFVRHEASLPPWAVRYRSIFGAPLEAEWIAGGWTSHVSVRTEGGGPDHHVDFFGRRPIVTGTGRSWVGSRREAELTALHGAFDTPDDLSAWPAELDGGVDRP